MSLLVQGPARTDGGTTLVYVGTPLVAIAWSASNGTLTRSATATNEAGVASAYLDTRGVPEGTKITVTVEAFT